MTSEQIKVRGGGRRVREKPDTLFSYTPPASSASPNHPPYALPPRSPRVSLSLFWPPTPQWYPEAGVLLKQKSTVAPSYPWVLHQHSTNIGQKVFKIKNSRKIPKQQNLNLQCAKSFLHCIYNYLCSIYNVFGIISTQVALVVKKLTANAGD